MRWQSVFLVCLLFLASSAPASGQDRRVPGMAQADIHNPFSPKYTPLVPDAGPVKSFYWSAGGGGYGFGYDPFYDPGYWPPYYYDPYWSGPFVFAPLYIPAESLYGPQALGRFFGLDQQPSPVAANVAPAPQAPQLGGGFGALAPAKPAPARPKVRAANAAAVARARQFIGFGDEQFSRQNFSGAYQRYKKAASAAPDLGDAYFRQGFALVAQGHYTKAAAAFERGLLFDENWADSGFRLDRLYGANRLAKAAHLEALAEAALNAPDDPALLFLLGVYLYFDEQPDRSRNFFLRARELSLRGGGMGHLRGFLAALDMNGNAELADGEAPGEELPDEVGDDEPAGREL